MSKKAADHHKKASEYHGHAARHHGEAAKHHEASATRKRHIMPIQRGAMPFMLRNVPSTPQRLMAMSMEKSRFDAPASALRNAVSAPPN
jgi:hypothetical protein